MVGQLIVFDGCIKIEGAGVAHAEVFYIWYIEKMYSCHVRANRGSLKVALVDATCVD